MQSDDQSETALVSKAEPRETTVSRSVYTYERSNAKYVSKHVQYNSRPIHTILLQRAKATL